MLKETATPWPSFLLVGIAAASSLLCVILIAIAMGVAWLEIEYTGGECNDSYEIFLYNGMCNGAACISWSSSFWESFELAEDATSIWPSAGVLVATGLVFSACAALMTTLSALSMVSLRFGQLALLSNTFIAFMSLFAGLILVTTSDSMNPDMWAPIRDKIENNFHITYACRTIVHQQSPISLAITTLIIQAIVALFLAFPGCFGYLPELAHYGHTKVHSAIDEFDEQEMEEMKL